jgi:hypothetical protein
MAKKDTFLIFIITLFIQQKLLASILPVGTQISTNTQIDQNWINTHLSPYTIIGSNITISLAENITFNSNNQYFDIQGSNVIFNGKGKNITALNMSSYQGLIYCNTLTYASTATIKNVGIIASGTTSLGGYCGWIAAGNTNYATITNCYSTGNFGEFGGGIAGYSNYGAISNCYSTGNIGNYGGGIAGYGNRGIITNCYSTGNIGNYGGGIAGYDNGSSISNCYSRGNIGNYGGGIVGYGNRASISNCYSTGNISSGGGIAGYDNRSSINNCYATGSGPLSMSPGTGETILNSFSENGGSWNSTNANLYLLSVGSIWDNTILNSPYLLFQVLDPELSLFSPSVTLTSSCTIIGPSSPTSFDLTGSNLSSIVTISAPTGFEISTIFNSNFLSSLSLTPSSGTISSTLYIRLINAAANGISGTIAASSAGVTTQTATVSSTIVAPPSFSPSASGPFSVCNEATYLVALATPNAYNGWTTSDPNVLSVNSAGYITANASGTATATITYTDACGQSVSQTVSVLPAAPSLPITDNRVAFKFNGNPQGPSAGSAIINYVGYDGYTYLSQTQPTQVGYYKANTQLGNEAGCPNRFYIFNCTTCNN